MKGWKITKPLTIEEGDIPETTDNVKMTKVRITKCLITLPDILHFNGEIECENVVPGSTGIGIVSEAETNFFDLEKGKHVYIQHTRECGKCYNCATGDFSNCSNLQVAGQDFEGFLTDFANVPNNKLYLLPENVSDFEALFIKHISLALCIVDQLKIQKGDYVAIVGGNNFGNILAQLIIYYQAVPIVLTQDDEEYKIAKNSGIYYVFNKEDNWQKEVLNITSGRLAENVVYIADSEIPANKAFSLASNNAKVAFTGTVLKNSPIPFAQAIKKNLQILCISDEHDNTASSINLIANKAINLSELKLDTTSYQAVPETFNKLNELFQKEGKIFETVVDMI